MSKFLKGDYQPLNKDKYVGSYPITYRSSWELMVCRMCDMNNSIAAWASEPVKIPYLNPLTGKQTVYVPDFMVQFMDKNGKTKTEMWEIKPKKQTYVSEAKYDKDKLSLAVNAAKWQAAQRWCSVNGCFFRVITEDLLFR